MSKLLEPTKINIFFSIISSPNLEIDIKQVIEEEIGELSIFEPEFNPSLKYYTKEMGEGLRRYILYNYTTHSRECFIDFKLRATQIEEKYSLNGKRLVNIDVGLLSLEQMLLATGKPYAHRIYIKSGVWADLHYTYTNKSYHSLPWTYPDYGHQEKVDFFNSLRTRTFLK